MNKSFIFSITLLVITTMLLIGCGSSTSDKAFTDAFKRSFNDDAEEVEDDYDIEYVLYRNNWEVRDSEKSRLAELLSRMIGKRIPKPPIKVYEGYFTFRSDHRYSRGRCLDIAAKCNINGQDRWIFLDCGETYVSDKKLYTAKKWYLSLRDLDSNDIKESWAWCDYDKKEIEDNFWCPYITYASDNYIYMTSGVYLRSY